MRKNYLTHKDRKWLQDMLDCRRNELEMSKPKDASFVAGMIHQLECVLRKFEVDFVEKEK